MLVGGQRQVAEPAPGAGQQLGAPAARRDVRAARRRRRDRARRGCRRCRRAARACGRGRTRRARRSSRRSPRTPRRGTRRRRGAPPCSHASASASFGASSPGTWPSTVLNAVSAALDVVLRRARPRPLSHTARHSHGFVGEHARRSAGRPGRTSPASIAARAFASCTSTVCCGRLLAARAAAGRARRARRRRARSPPGRCGRRAARGRSVHDSSAPAAVGAPNSSDGLECVGRRLAGVDRDDLAQHADQLVAQLVGRSGSGRRDSARSPSAARGTASRSAGTAACPRPAGSVATYVLW